MKDTIGVCEFSVDRNYFGSSYDATVQYRLKWRKFAVSAAWVFAAILFFLAFALKVRLVFYVVVVAFSVRALWETMGHRSRWLNSVSTIAETFDFNKWTFAPDQVLIESDLTRAEHQYAVYSRCDATPDGLFLVKHDGAIFLPRKSFTSSEECDRVHLFLKTRLARSVHG